MNDLRINNGTPPPVYPGTRSAPLVEEKKVAAEQKQAATPLQNASEQAEQIKQQSKPENSLKEAKRLSEELQRRVGGADSQLQFSVDESTGESVIKVMDKATNEMIRQIPSEEMLQIAKALDRFQESFLVNSKA